MGPGWAQQAATCWQGRQEQHLGPVVQPAWLLDGLQILAALPGRRGN